MSEQQKAFTGRTRQRATKKSILFSDVVAQVIITAGGLGTILAVLGVFVFLLAKIVPLFDDAEISDHRQVQLPVTEKRPLRIGLDEYQALGYVLTRGGELKVFRIDDGSVRQTEKLFEGVGPTCASFLVDRPLAVFGFEDGRIEVVEVDFKTSFPRPENIATDLQEKLKSLVLDSEKAEEEDPYRHCVDFEDGVLQLTPQGQFRKQALAVKKVVSQKVSEHPVRQVTHAVRGSGPTLIMLSGATSADRMQLIAGRAEKDFLTGEEKLTFGKPQDLPFKPLSQAKPMFVGLNGTGTDVFVAWEDGWMLRVYKPRGEEGFIASEGRLTPEGVSLTMAGFIIGNNTLVWGDSEGNVNGGFLVRPEVGFAELGVIAETFDYELKVETDAQGAVVASFLPLDTMTDEQRAENMKTVNPTVGRSMYEIGVLDPRDLKTTKHTVIEGALRNATFDLRVPDLFVKSKTLESSGPVATTLGPSGRNRLVFIGYEDGHVRLYNVTHAGRIADFEVGYDKHHEDGAVEFIADGSTVNTVVFAPKEDGVFVVTDKGGYHAAVDPMHPSVTLGALFGRVWYEGYPGPTHAWQSSAAEQEAEPKYGLMPLIFGTIKATIYAMLFGVPIALFAAIYSSEFLNPKAKAAIKPTVEMMASLPSVVLGFLAGLVIAPFVENIVPATLTSFITIPFAFLLASFLWQLLPQHFTIRAADWRIAVMILPMALGIFLASVLGPVIESMLFAGSIKEWLAWAAGSFLNAQAKFANSTGGWMILLLPLAAVAAVWISGRFITPRFRYSATPRTRGRLAQLDLLKFVGCAAFTLVLAWAAGSFLNAIGFDPRGKLTIWDMNFSPVDIYVQRNALIVGFIMGFAIIPIIYTIADDALSSVPEHLRSASLGAGATPWQTATRIIIPTAMSGLFSAVMIGLGRAVGETMIVLMAAGNTPVLDMNIFEGFRTLSANIAVELPEAPKDETHYRILFFAALVLFAMTCVVNTFAELIRQRFRKRAVQL